MARATCSSIAPICRPGVIALFEGQAVTFDIERTSRGLRAVNIAVEKSE